MGRRAKTLVATSAKKAQRHPSSDTPEVSSANSCEVAAVGKRRDGSTRFWCVRHHGDATEKHGRPAKTCRNAKNSPVGPNEVFTLNWDEYAGGIALWGAAPPVYDTTTFPLERGIHVHARPKIGADKEIDNSYAAVRLVGSTVPNGGILVSESDAVISLARPGPF